MVDKHYSADISVYVLCLFKFRSPARFGLFSLSPSFRIALMVLQTSRSLKTLAPRLARRVPNVRFASQCESSPNRIARNTYPVISCSGRNLQMGGQILQQAMGHAFLTFVSGPAKHGIVAYRRGTGH